MAIYMAKHARQPKGKRGTKERESEQEKEERRAETDERRDHTRPRCFGHTKPTRPGNGEQPTNGGGR